MYVWPAERVSGEMINSMRMPNAKLVFVNGISNLGTKVPWSSG